MPVVITSACQTCLDAGCVEVCPTDAIVQHRPATGVSDLPDQLFVRTDQCICCNACVPECPADAIVDEEDASPEVVSLNALSMLRRHEFDVPEVRLLRARGPRSQPAHDP